MTRKFTLLGPFLFAIAALHAVFAWKHRDLRTGLEVLAPPPDRLFSQAVAAGDGQFLYRVWALDLQNAGDTGGRATPMRNYNYDYVLGWLEALQALDPRAHQHAYLAGNYFSLSQNLDDVRRVVGFLVSDADRFPEEKWVWAMRGVEIALARLKDVDYALALSQHVAAYDLPSISFSVMTMPAVLLEKLGRYDEARTSMEKVLERRSVSISSEEKIWTESFISRLSKE